MMTEQSWAGDTTEDGMKIDDSRIINLNESCIMVMSGVMSVYVCLCIRDSVSVGPSNNLTI